MKSLRVLWLTVTILILCQVDATIATSIKYEFSGHIESKVGPLSPMNVGDKVSGWMILDSDFFVPGGYAMMDEGLGPRPDGLPFGLIDYFFDPAFWSFQVGSGGSCPDYFQGATVTWGQTLYNLPSFSGVLYDDGKFGFNQKIFSIHVLATLQDDTVWEGTIDTFKVATPEPTTTILFGTGIVWLAAAGRKGRKCKYFLDLT